MRLILYSKPGCHLCEGLQEKLQQIQTLPFELEVRDITTREDWLLSYQYEVPVLMLARSIAADLDSAADLLLLPRLSPRASVQQLERMLQTYWMEFEQNKPQ